MSCHLERSVGTEKPSTLEEGWLSGAGVKISGGYGQPLQNTGHQGPFPREQMLRPSNFLQERKAALVKTLSDEDGAGGVQLSFPKCSAENQVTAF